MMGSLSEEEYRFFDAHEEIASVLDCPESFDSSFRLSSSEYEVWSRSPQSVYERRSKFLNIMGLNFDWTVLENPIDDVCGGMYKGEVDRIMQNSGAVLRTPIFEDEFSSSRSSTSSWSKDASNLAEELGIFSRTGNSDDGGPMSNVDELWRDAKLDELRVAGSDRLEMAEDSRSTFESSPLVQQVTSRGINCEMGMTNRNKKRWLSRLRSFTCIANGQVKEDSLRLNGRDPVCGERVQRVRVRQCKKQTKELSALFTGQDIQAHKGSILAMKFSPDGQYLASAGEDGIVRVWQVIEDVRSNETDVPEIDPSCIYFTVNHLSELAPLMVEKEKMGILRSLRKTAESACVIFPPKVFRILEKPLHEFHGHNGDILDLSWSENNYLLSSSVDKTVRLWRVGCDHCLNVFSHSNYVTCIEFNPMDDNYFVSGSIDGKVRLWAINGCQVVDWTDIKDIVTAVCYRPDGQGAVVGSMTGSCRFYNISDNHFQLESHVCLHSKKKSPCRRITGFKFFPQDPSKLMVTCADSQVRILHGINVVAKYRGVRSGGNQMFASFTSDGKHIVSASEDSNVYVWNCISHENSSPSQPKLIKSFERFSANASVAIPWSGLKPWDSDSGRQFHTLNRSSPNSSSPTCFSLGQEFMLESFPKGSATWPEEKLPTSSTPSAIRKSQYKFLKSSCQSTSTSHAWGLVIVTAGWDGRIRSFHNYGLPVPI